MHYLWLALACVVLASKISTAKCCTTVACEDANTCGDRYFVLCLRPPNFPRENRQSCTFHFSNNGSELIGKELIRKDFKPAADGATVTEPYAGGFQVYIGVLRIPDLPPFRPSSIIVDEVFIVAESVANSGEILTSPVTGQNMLVNISMSLRVDCVLGFGGLACDTVYMCRDGITCNSTIGYCNSQGECVCHEGVMEATCVKNVSGSVSMCRDGITCNSTIEYCNSQGECVCHEGVMEATCVKNVSGSVSMCRDGITCNSTIEYCNSQGECVCHEGVMEATCVKNVGGSDSSIVPVAVGASFGGFLLLLLLIIVVVAAVLIYRKKIRKNPGDLYVLSSSEYSSAKHSAPPIPLYSKVNKDKKKRDEPPPIVPPYRGNYIPYYDAGADKSDVRVSDVTYAKTIHREDSGYHNAQTETEVNGTEAQRPTAKPRSRKGVEYAEIDHEDITTTTFQRSSSSQQPQGEIVKYSDITRNAIYENVREIDKPETMYFEVKN